MVCPKCGNEVRVVDTIHNDRDNVIYRVRRCMSCRQNIYTAEIEVELNSTLRQTLTEYHRLYKLKRATSQSSATRSRGNPVKVRCIDNGKIFESASAAARSVNVGRNRVCLCCQGKTKTAGGKKWEYYKENKENEE